MLLFQDHRVAPYRAEQILQRENQHPDRETPGRKRTLLSASRSHGQSGTEHGGAPKLKRVQGHNLLRADMMNRIAIRLSYGTSFRPIAKSKSHSFSKTHPPAREPWQNRVKAYVSNTAEGRFSQAFLRKLQGEVPKNLR